MSVIKLEKVTVSYVNGKGVGFKVVDESTVGDKTYKQIFSVWPVLDAGVKVGDVISLSGFLSAKVGEPWAGSDGELRTSVELSVNSRGLMWPPTVPIAPRSDHRWYPILMSREQETAMTDQPEKETN